MKKYMILIFAVFFISCQKKNEKTIESITVWYYNGIFDRVMSIDCEEIRKGSLDVLLEDGEYFPKEAVILENVITDKDVLQEIAIELCERKVIEENYVNARMKCHISFNNGQTDSLCVSDNPTYAIYNNKPVKLTNKLVYLIRENCGFYQWIGIDYLKYFDELNDSSFKRKKVKNRWREAY